MCLKRGFLRDSLTLGRKRGSPRRARCVAEQYSGPALADARASGRHPSQPTPARSVPPLILRPLVENAVRHSIATLIEGGLVIDTAGGSGSSSSSRIRGRRLEARHQFSVDIVRRRLAAAFSITAAASR